MRYNDIAILGKKGLRSLPASIGELNYTISGADYAYARGFFEDTNRHLQCNFKLISDEPVSCEWRTRLLNYHQPVCDKLNNKVLLNVAAFNISYFLRKQRRRSYHPANDARLLAYFMNKLKDIHPDAGLAAITHYDPRDTTECNASPSLHINAGKNPLKQNNSDITTPCFTQNVKKIEPKGTHIITHLENSTYICCFPGEVTKYDFSQPDADTRLRVKSKFFAALWHMKLMTEKELFQEGTLSGAYIHTVPEEKRKLEIKDNIALLEKTKAHKSAVQKTPSYYSTLILPLIPLPQSAILLKAPCISKRDWSKHYTAYVYNFNTP